MRLIEHLGKIEHDLATFENCDYFDRQDEIHVKLRLSIFFKLVKNDKMLRAELGEKEDPWLG